jgi:predicted O-methyltransferase YrrM
MPELAIIVPTRGRPENIRKVIAAWDFTNAWDHADLILAVDADDPEIQGYRSIVAGSEHRQALRPGGVSLIVAPQWKPMVHKLNDVATTVEADLRYFALGFAGDDHLPETIGWAKSYLDALKELGTGMVYGDDGYQGKKLSTEWAITADVVRTLGRMVPAPVEHMYCDNSMMDLFDGAGALRHLPEIRIEHRHPIAGKAKTDDQYERVNHRDQFRKDRLAYEVWRRSKMTGDILAVRALRPNAPEFRVVQARPTPPARPKVRTRTGVLRSRPTSERIGSVTRFPFHQEFKNVRGATPDEIGMTLADFATQVPADQEIVELGVFNGRTALIMAWGAKQGHGAHVTAIDPWDLEGNVYDPPFTDTESRNWAQYWVRTLGYDDRIDLVQNFSHDVAEYWGEPDASGLIFKQVGLLFVDGDHTKEGARRDIESWAPHLAPGAVIAVDDYGHPDWPGVGEAVDELVDEGFLEPVQVFHDRLAVTKLTRPASIMHSPVVAAGWVEPKITAITSEGVSPAPDLDDDNLFAMEAEVDASLSTPDPAFVVYGELGDVPAGKPIEELNLVQLKALSKARGIVLGARKDKRSAIITALIEGK